MSGVPLFHESPLFHYLLVSGVLFSAGLFTLLTRKHAVALLMGIELVLNAANLNFVAFAQFADRAGMHGLTDGVAEGNVFALFVIVLAAAEAAVAFAIVIGIYQSLRTVDVDAADELKE